MLSKNHRLIHVLNELQISPLTKPHAQHFENKATTQKVNEIPHFFRTIDKKQV